MTRRAVLGGSLGLATTLFFSCRSYEPESGAYFFAHRVSESRTEYDESRFRSFRKDGQLAGTITFGDPVAHTESRFSLIPPLPSRFTFTVDVPANGRLDFELGVAALGAETLPAPVTFSVEINDVPVFEETVRRRFGNRWYPRSVDLSRWSGTRIELTLDTRFQETLFIDPNELESSVLPAWGNPVLSGTGSDLGRPDLILVSIDCLRADHMGAYGYSRPTTPTIDALAADGLVFENSVSVSSWTLPTHMSMLTGVMPSVHGLRRGQKRRPSVPYLPEILSRQGYETIGVVSGLYLSTAFGYEQGFDLYRTLIDAPAEDLVDSALSLFFAGPTRPRFLFLHFFNAHWPYLPEEKYLDRVGGRPGEISDLLDNVILQRAPRSPDEIDGTKRLYDAEVAYVDEQLGHFFEELKRRKIYDNALIVVTSDHGEGFYEHGQWQHSQIIYNEVTRVPLIVKPPHSSVRRRVSGVVSQLGILPTFLEAVGLEAPFEHPGLLTLAKEGASFPQILMSEITWEPKETTGATVRLAATQDDLKYIATFKGGIGDDRFVSKLVQEELYDLSHDPDEKDNLLPGAADKAGPLRRSVRAYLDVMRQSRASGGGERIVVDDSVEEKLRALGYVQ